MAVSRSSFVEQWSQSLAQGSGAAFVGAGVSQGAGYPSWRQLLQEVSDELGLDINNEHDLPAVAQYHLNRLGGKRTRLSDLILKEFAGERQPPNALMHLARLPLRQVWTTNYDRLIESSWREQRQPLRVCSTNSDLGLESPWASTTLYKMHGSVDQPAHVVIAKDDYELYRRLRPGFLQMLQGHLLSKRFLFIGFSFSDPNIGHLFSNLRESFGDDGPQHFSIVRKPERSTKKKVDAIRHGLWVDDLQRYGIQCVEVQSHDEISDILSEIEGRLARRNVFVSGSFPPAIATHDGVDRSRVVEVARAVGRAAVLAEKKLVSGMGLTIGDPLVAGALELILKQDIPNLDRHLLLRPFPQAPSKGIDPIKFRTQYRESMLSQCGFCVVIAGVRSEDGSKSSKASVAPGVLEEVDIARKLGRIVVPVGSTGGAARHVWMEMQRKLSKASWPASRGDFEALGDPRKQPDEIGKILGRVFTAADKVKSSPPR